MASNWWWTEVKEKQDLALEAQIERDRKQLAAYQTMLQGLQVTQIAYKEKTIARFKMLLKQGQIGQVQQEFYVYKVTFTHLSERIAKMKKEIWKIKSRKYKCYLTGELYSPF